MWKSSKNVTYILDIREHNKAKNKTQILRVRMNAVNNNL